MKWTTTKNHFQYAYIRSFGHPPTDIYTDVASRCICDIAVCCGWDSQVKQWWCNDQIERLIEMDWNMAKVTHCVLLVCSAEEQRLRSLRKPCVCMHPNECMWRHPSISMYRSNYADGKLFTINQSAGNMSAVFLSWTNGMFVFTAQYVFLHYKICRQIVWDSLARVGSRRHSASQQAFKWFRFIVQLNCDLFSFTCMKTCNMTNKCVCVADSMTITLCICIYVRISLHLAYNFIRDFVFYCIPNFLPLPAQMEKVQD